MSGHPFFLKKVAGGASKKQERRLAKSFNGRTTPASGSKPPPSCKGDVRTETLHIEAKTTAKMTYRLELSVLRELEREAFEDGNRFPVLCIEFNDPAPYVNKTKEWAVIPMEFLKSLLGGNEDG